MKRISPGINITSEPVLRRESSMSEFLNIAVSGESPMDFSQELLEKEEIKAIPFHIAFDETDHLDGTFKNEEMFAYFDRTGKVPQSGAPSIEEYKRLFASCLENHDAVLHISMSGLLSSGYQNAVAASKEFPEGKVEVIDSRTISLGIGIIALKAKEIIKKGVKTLAEAKEKAAAFVGKIKASLLIDRLEYMYRGGRCSKLVLLGATRDKIAETARKHGFHDIVMAGAGKHTGNLDKLMIVHSPRRVTAMFCDLNILFTAEIVIRIRDMPPALRQSIHILAILVGVL